MKLYADVDVNYELLFKLALFELEIWTPSENISKLSKPFNAPGLSSEVINLFPNLNWLSTLAQLTEIYFPGKSNKLSNKLIMSEQLDNTRFYFLLSLFLI